MKKTLVEFCLKYNRNGNYLKQVNIKSLEINYDGKVLVDNYFISPFEYFNIYVQLYLFFIYIIMMYSIDINYGRDNEKVVYTKLISFFPNEIIKELDYCNEFDYSNQNLTI